MQDNKVKFTVPVEWLYKGRNGYGTSTGIDVQPVGQLSNSLATILLHPITSKGGVTDSCRIPIPLADVNALIRRLQEARNYLVSQAPEDQPGKPARQYRLSPELPGVGYWCQTCGNTIKFVGYDDNGDPGDDCECGARESEDGRHCTCEVTLRQVFIVDDGGDVDYLEFTGGGFGSEIGSYTRIYCDKCNALLWYDETNDKASSSAGADAAAAKLATGKEE